ncbi:MAG: peptidoglycan recognition family protein [Chthoniobacteraceae bacterium]
MRFSTSLLLAIFFAAPIVRAQQAGGSTDDAEKKKAFLKAREQMRTVPLATPPPSAPPKPKPQPAPQPTTTPTTPKPAPVPEPTARPTTKPKPKPVAKGTPRARATPLFVITPKPAPKTPAPSRQRELPAPVTVQKSGFENAEILPVEKKRGWFSGGPSYRFLTASVRSEIDKAPVKKGRWRYTVVHNSGTRQGSAKAFDYYHKRVRKMPNGLAYHFVIGNGTSTGDGEIEIGNRWRRQINGGHVHSDYLNNISLGICFVGDFNRDVPTERQKAALDELITYLRKRVGKIDGKVSIVKAHKEINPPRWGTDCPGNRFPYRWLHGKYD